MSELFFGVDFGTTNSSVAAADGDSVRVIPLDPLNDPVTSLPSLLYIDREGEHSVGRAAANTFIERNVDREVVVRQVDLGAYIEGYVGGEGDNEYGSGPRKDGMDIQEAVSAKALLEVNAPGRLFQSLKTLLRMRDFTGTEVFGRHYQIEELTSLILKRLKEAIDQTAGRSVDTAVFGRPVRFSRSEEEDAAAEHRLETAARLAGFKHVAFFYEPVGACIEFATSTKSAQKLMVIDIGGGTFDVCIMEFAGASDSKSRLAQSRILAVEGVPVAGDAIDNEITRARIFPLLGSRARYGPSTLRLPQYLFNAILDWQNLYRLNTEETINWLIAAEVSSDQPKAIRMLRTLIQRNLGYPLSREVEAAKKRLSDVQGTTIRFEREPIRIDERLERGELAGIIGHMLDEMSLALAGVERLAGIGPNDLDLVLTTGGTSLIPAVQDMLEARYTAEKIRRRDTFTSVATGLAIAARHL